MLGMRQVEVVRRRRVCCRQERHWLRGVRVGIHVDARSVSAVPCAGMGCIASTAGPAGLGRGGALLPQTRCQPERAVAVRTGERAA